MGDRVGGRPRHRAERPPAVLTRERAGAAAGLIAALDRRISSQVLPAGPSPPAPMEGSPSGGAVFVQQRSGIGAAAAFRLPAVGSPVRRPDAARAGCLAWVGPLGDNPRLKTGASPVSVPAVSS